ncbi:hypothetical protein Tco_0473077 [Tanacetum coccineum]
MHEDYEYVKSLEKEVDELEYEKADFSNMYDLLLEEYAKSHKTTKRYVPVEKTSESKKPERLIPKGHRVSHRKTTTVPEKTRSPKSCLRWQPMGRILKTVCLRWVPTGRLFNSCREGNQCQNGFTKDEIHQMASAENNTSGPAPFLNVKKTFDHSRSSLSLHQMTSDHNRSELGIQDHSNEPSSSKLVPKVVPLANKTATSRQELELLFHLHIAMLRTTGINPMIQPEPEDLPKDNPKLEIAVLRTFRVILFSIHNDEWKFFQCHHQTALR